MPDRAIVIGVMGPGEGASDQNLHMARELGAFIARKGWVLLSGGRNQGVMQACNQAARQLGGLTLGFLPGNDRREASPDVLLPIPTGLGHARNVLNIQASDLVVICGFGMGPGTLSELALALKTRKPVILMTDQPHFTSFLQGFNAPDLQIVNTMAQAKPLIEASIQQLLQQEDAALVGMSCFAAGS